ncbi:hypothetical protein J3R30DRAFT_833314 [Lentinula aciculospora]|uniref:Uncharacterized protein n=1 Tax=Lentinula aciculospora TaxID=153920 RepID=A0A9W9DW33_9AGAR|nr:hypothetical protein J3R30DRAFT_833314 [Lentinula aciculospora]
MGCIMRGWTNRKLIPPLGPMVERAEIIHKRNSSKKRVSWFDGYENDEGRVPDTDLEVKPTDEQPSSNMGGKEYSMNIDEAEGMIVMPMETDDKATDTDTAIHVWYCDLIEDDEDDLNTVFNGEPISSAYHIDDLGSSSGFSSATCTVKYCQNFLPSNSTWKCCSSCRKYHQEYQKKQSGCDIKNDGNNPKSLLSSQPTSASKAETGRLSFSNKRLGSYILHDPAGLVTAGARICTIRGCKHIVPDQVEYKYKSCFPCRMRATRNAKIRQARADRQVKVASGLIMEDEVPIELTFPLVNAAPPQNPLRAAVGRCASIDCGMRIEPPKLKSLQAKAKHRIGNADPEPALSCIASKNETHDEETEAICEQCRWRRLPPTIRRTQKVEVHKRLKIVAVTEDSEHDPSTDTGKEIGTGGSSQLKPCIKLSVPVIRLPHRLIPPPKPRKPTPYPEYQTLARLIRGLQILFESYLQAHGFYLAFNLREQFPTISPSGGVDSTENLSDPSTLIRSDTTYSDDTLQSFNPCSHSEKRNATSKTMSRFAFDGEFSIVAPDFDMIARQGEVKEFVTRVMHQVEKVTLVTFL